MFEKIARLDQRISAWIQRHCRREWLDGFVAAFTHLGDLGAIWILWAVYLFWMERINSLILVGSIAICAIVCNLIMKPLFARQRPFEIHDTDLLIAEPRDHSFPSGHTMASFTGAAVLATVFGGWTAVLAFGLAALIALSRLYLFVHHPSDVIAGAIFGTILGKVCAVCGQVPAQWLADWLTKLLGI